MATVPAPGEVTTHPNQKPPSVSRCHALCHALGRGLGGLLSGGLGGLQVLGGLGGLGGGVMDGLWKTQYSSGSVD